MEGSSIIKEIEKILYGKRQDKITPFEVNALVHLPANDELNVIVFRGLLSKILDPDITLLQILTGNLTTNHILLISLCLRYGANPNMYVSAYELGNIHIIGYVYSMLDGNDESLKDTILSMLLLKGSSINSTIYKKTDTTVLNWLNTNYPKHNLTLDPIQSRFTNDDIVLMSIILDDPDILIGTDFSYSDTDMLLAIKYFNMKTFDKIPYYSEMYYFDFEILFLSFNRLNSYAFDKIVKNGYLPSYILVTQLLNSMKQYQDPMSIVYNELQKILLSVISTGFRFDTYQMNMIRTFNKESFGKIIMEYEQPNWHKVCKSTNTNSEILEQIAFSLNINTELQSNTICDLLSTIFKADKQQLKDAFKKRQQIRMSNDLSRITEFINGNAPLLTYKNKSSLNKDAFDYIDMDIAYYRDDNNAVWCFISDYYKSMIDTGINPYNKSSLPSLFIDELIYKYDIIMKIRNSDKAVSFSESLDKLGEKDTVDDSNTNIVINEFIKTAIKYGIDYQVFNSINKDIILSAFRIINYDIDLTYVTNEHALLLLAHLGVYIINYEPYIIDDFFVSLSY